MTAADDPADRASPPDRGHLDRAAARQIDHHRDHRRPEGKEVRLRLVAAGQHDLAGFELYQLAVASIKARFPGECRKQAVAGEGLIGLGHFID